MGRHHLDTFDQLLLYALVRLGTDAAEGIPQTEVVGLAVVARIVLHRHLVDGELPT